MDYSPVVEREIIESMYCSCSEPDFEKDPNNYLFCNNCGKESESNYIDFSPSEEQMEDLDLMFME